MFRSSSSSEGPSRKVAQENVAPSSISRNIRFCLSFLSGRLQTVRYGIKLGTYFYETSVVDFINAADEIKSYILGNPDEIVFILPCHNVFLKSFLSFQDTMRQCMDFISFINH